MKDLINDIGQYATKAYNCLKYGYNHEDDPIIFNHDQFKKFGLYNDRLLGLFMHYDYHDFDPALIQEVNDIQILGNSIVSLESMMDDHENSYAFLKAIVERLIALCRNYRYSYYGIPSELTLKTYMEDYENVLQELTIKDNGSVDIKLYKYINNQYICYKSNYDLYDEKFACGLLQCIANLFKTDFPYESETDHGYFELSITNTLNKTFNIKSGIHSLFPTYMDMDINKYIRIELNNDSLYLFDGLMAMPTVEKLEMYLNNEYLNIPLGAFVDVEEHLVVDQKEISFTTTLNDGITFTRTVTNFDKIHKLFDLINDNAVFDDIEDYNEEQGEFKLVLYYPNMKKTIKSELRINHLPEAITDVLAYIQYIFDYNQASYIFNANYFLQEDYQEDKYMYCLVEVEEASKLLWYRTDIESLRVNDVVLVPFGKSNETRIGKIVRIRFYDYDDVPFPVHKTKEIEERITKEDK